jgi:hypothetical protein
MPAEDQTLALIGEVIGEMVSDEGNPISIEDEVLDGEQDVNDQDPESSEEPKKAKSKKSEKTTKKDEAEEDGDIDFGDMPNGEIRYKKLKQANAELKAELEKAKLELGNKSVKEEAKNDPDYMTENEKLLYEQQQKLTKELEALKNKEKDKEYSDREAIFLSNHSEFGDFEKNPEQTMERAKEFFFDFFEANPSLKGMAKMIASNDVTLEQVYAMATVNNKTVQKKVVKTQDSSNIFGDGKKKATSSFKNEMYDDDVNQAYRDLNNPFSDRKEEAVDIATDALVDDIVAFMGRQ